MEGLFVAGAVVAAIRFARSRDRALAGLAFFLAFLAGVESREAWEPERRRFQLGAVAAGVAMAAMIASRSGPAHHERQP